MMWPSGKSDTPQVTRAQRARQGVGDGDGDGDAMRAGCEGRQRAVAFEC